jgi:uncharacterized protein (TIGR03435 family)
MAKSTRALLISSLGIFVLAIQVRSQTPTTPKPAFEVASIKPSNAPPGTASGLSTTKGRIAGRNVTLKRSVRGAYDIPETLIFGGPKWIDQDRYDIDATTTGPAGDHDMMVMLQSLLADRFHLVLHREQRQISGYTLVLAKGGIKAKAATKDATAKTSRSRGIIEAQASTMANLAQKLSEALATPVTDATKLEALRFNFTLKWNPDEAKTVIPVSSGKAVDEVPSIFSALQEQLGLKLESSKAMVDVIVVDSAEKPSEN